MMCFHRGALVLCSASVLLQLCEHVSLQDSCRRCPCVNVCNLITICSLLELIVLLIRDGPLEQLWGGGEERGIFEQREFFSLMFPLNEYFFFCQDDVREYFFHNGLLYTRYPVLYVHWYCAISYFFAEILHVNSITNNKSRQECFRLKHESCQCSFITGHKIRYSYDITKRV